MRGLANSTQAYFDCNATTPVLPSAAKAALETMKTLYGNPSSAHFMGLQAKNVLDSNRKLIAKIIMAEPEQIIFTSGATEAIQTAIFSALQTRRETNSSPHLNKILYGATEHKVVPQALKHWTKILNLPVEIAELRVNQQGQIDLSQLRRELPATFLVCTMAVNNETGVIQNLSAIESILTETQSNALWLVDCVQALGKVNLGFQSSRIDYAAFSGHKLYAPKGVGFLYVRKTAPFIPLIVGGGQEDGRRSGTENLPAIAAFGTVFEELFNNPHEQNSILSNNLQKFRSKLIYELKQSFPTIEFNTPFEESVPTTINFSIPGYNSSELLDLFDAAGMRLSTGSACNSSSARPSHVLEAMGIPRWRSTSSLRLSFGPLTSEREIKTGCEIIRRVALTLKKAFADVQETKYNQVSNLDCHVVQFRGGSENSWLITNRESKNCVIIHPAEQVLELITNFVISQNLTVVAVLDAGSHAHSPLYGSTLKGHLKCNPCISKTKKNPSGWPVESEHIIDLFLDNNLPVQAVRIARYPTGDLVLARVKTSTHTNHSTTYLLGTSQDNQLNKKNIHFAFTDGPIRTEEPQQLDVLKSECSSTLLSAANFLRPLLNPTTLICPSYDYHNIFATHLKAEDMVLSNNISSWNLQEMTSNSPKKFDSSPIIEFDQFRELLIQNPNISVIDVREPLEHTRFNDWQTLGLKFHPRNIPLSRFVNFMAELVYAEYNNENIIFLCKTGARSLQATIALRRLGFTQAHSLEGGLIKAFNLIRERNSWLL